MFAESSGISTQQWFLLGGLALFSLVLLTSWRGRRKLDGSPKQYRREIDGATRESAAVHRDLEILIRELNELSATIGAQMDSRYKKLRETMHEADQRIAELRALIERVDDALETLDAGGNAHGESAADEVASENVRSTQLDWIVNDEAARSIRNEPDELIVTRATAKEPTPLQRTPAPPDEMDILNRRVCELAREGHHPVQIAEVVNRTVGEVELILHLDRRSTKQTHPIART